MTESKLPLADALETWAEVLEQYHTDQASEHARVDKEAAALLRQLAEGHQVRVNDMKHLKTMARNGASIDELVHYFENIEMDSERLLKAAEGEQS